MADQMVVQKADHMVVHLFVQWAVHLVDKMGAVQ